jgi:hypothetical protein
MRRHGPNLFPGNFVTCVFNPDRALCLRQQAAQPGPALERRPSSRAARWLVGGWRAMTWRLWTTAVRRRSNRFVRGPR